MLPNTTSALFSAPTTWRNGSCGSATPMRLMSPVTISLAGTCPPIFCRSVPLERAAVQGRALHGTP